jgi:hypothetical protein
MIFIGIGVLLTVGLCLESYVTKSLIFNPQAVRDSAADYSRLVQLFEQIHFFVQHLNSYTGMALTRDFTELLGKIMAQVLSILTLSTKAMTQRRISKSINVLHSCESDFGSEKYVKKLVGRTDIEDALLWLESLMKEEGLMAAAKNLEVVQVVEECRHRFTSLQVHKL